MRKVTTKPLRLATEGDSWREMDAKIETSVNRICQDYNADTTEAFLFLVDLLTNTEYDAQDRHLAATSTLRAAFQYTDEFEAAQTAYLNKINPVRAQLAKVS